MDLISFLFWATQPTHPGEDLGVVGKGWEGLKVQDTSGFDSLCSSPRPRPDHTLRGNVSGAHAACAPEETWG